MNSFLAVLADVIALVTFQQRRGSSSNRPGQPGRRYYTFASRR